MSVPWRIGAYTSATDAERVKRGSTTMSFAPRLRLRLGHALEAARMRLGGVAAHDDNEIGVLDVGPRVRHRTTAKRRSQTGHRRAVSDTRLVVEHEHAGAADHLVGQERRFVGGGRRGEEAGRASSG